MPGIAGLDDGVSGLPFDPQDVRETSNRFRLPAPRQAWVEVDGTLVNSADSQKRGMPPYLLIMDLGFAAFCVLAARLQHATNRYFGIMMSLLWIWTTINVRLCAYDQEDISSEIFVILLMGGVGGMALHLKPCTGYVGGEYVGDDGATEHHRNHTRAIGSMWLADANACFDFMVSFSYVRLLVMALSLYIAAHVPARASILWREAVSFVAWGPAFGALLYLCASSHPSMDPATSPWLEAIILATTVADILLSLGPGTPSLLVRRENLPASWQPLFQRTFEVVVPMSIPYFDTRYERLTLIAVGNVISNSVGSAFGIDAPPRVAAGFTVVIGVPLSAFLIKVFHFDLSTHHGSSSKGTHAMRISGYRSACWVLLHLPLFAAISWLAVSITDLVVKSLATPHPLPSTFKSVFNFCGAWVLFLLCQTSLHLLHKGSGPGARRLSRARRLMMRAAMAASLPGVAAAAVWYEVSSLGYFWLTMLLLTADAACELYGNRGQAVARDEASNEDECVRLSQEEGPVAAVAEEPTF